MKLGFKSKLIVSGLLCVVAAAAGWLSNGGESDKTEGTYPEGVQGSRDGGPKNGRGGKNELLPRGNNLPAQSQFFTMQQAERAAAENPSAFAEELINSETQPPSDIVDRFFEAWLKTQPIEAAEKAVTFPGRFRLNQSKVFTIAYKRLLQSRPDVAIALLEIGDGRIGDFYLYRGLSRELRDPELQALNVPPNFDSMAMSKEEFSKRISGMFPSYASKKLANQYGVYLGTAKTFEQAAEWGEALPEDFQDGVIRSLVFDGDRDEEIWSYFSTAPRGILRTVAPQFVVATSHEDPERAMKWLQGNLGVTSYDPNNSVLANWVQSDLEGAANYVSSLENPQKRHIAAAAVAQTLAKNDVSKALDWVQDRDQDWSGERQEILDSVVSYSLQFGVRNFETYIKKNPDQEFKSDLKRALEGSKNRVRGNEKERLLELLAKMN